MIQFFRGKPISQSALMIDSIAFKEAEITFGQGRIKTRDFRADVNSEKASKMIAAHRFSDLPSECEGLSLNKFYNFFLSTTDIRRQNISFSKYQPGKWMMSLNFHLNTINWKQLWSIREYLYEIKNIVSSNSQFGAKFDDQTEILFFTPSFRLSFSVEDNETTIEDELSAFENTAQALHELTVISLKSKLHNDSVVMQFDFPEEVRVPCEQYLLYFARFLKDLGVESEAALTHEAGQVLFTVTPADKEHALDNIRAALDVYLRLPSSPVRDTQQGEIAILRLNSELESFKSRLSLARAEIQMKEAAIQLQKATIAQLSGEIMIDSLKDVTPKPKDTEELFGGTVALKKYDGKFVEVDLPELYRKLKRLFEKEAE